MENSDRNMQVPYLLMLGVVAVVAVVVLIFNSSVGLQGTPLQGAAAHSRHVDTVEPVCVDTDEYNNYDKKGMVQLKQTQYDDYCWGGNVLYQRYCKPGARIGTTPGYTCPNGPNSCRDGACV